MELEILPNRNLNQLVKTFDQIEIERQQLLPIHLSQILLLLLLMILYFLHGSIDHHMRFQIPGLRIYDLDCYCLRRMNYGKRIFGEKDQIQPIGHMRVVGNLCIE